MLELYVETAVHLDPPHKDTVVNLDLPASSTSSHSLSLRNASSRSQTQDRARDEASFQKQHISDHGSIYFRQAGSYPRTFLWRVLEGGQILELRCADLVKSEHEVNEAYLTLRLKLEHAILPAGVALADVGDDEALSVFIITRGRQLHTLKLPLDFFRTTEASRRDSLTWCKTFVPSSFTIDLPYRLHAYSPYHLFVSLESGRIQSLTRNTGDDGSHWSQAMFDEKSWGASLRGMVKWHSAQAIQYDSRSYSHTTANAMVASSNAKHLYTICLNHTIRIWNLATGKLEVSRDLLDRVVAPHDPPTILSPAAPPFLRVFSVEYISHPILCTFSPHDGGQFKFWEVYDELLESIAVKDMFPSLQLSPPDPDPSGNTMWSLAGFEIRPGTVHEPTGLWLLWRNNNLYQLYTLSFDLRHPSEAWTSDWVGTHIFDATSAAPPEFVSSDPCDPTEKWLNFLFYPKRYSESVLETSLDIYRNAMRVESAAVDEMQTLQERVCASVASTVHLRKRNESNVDYLRYSIDTDTQWRNFWRTVDALSEKRKSPVSIVFDSYADTAWVLQADRCCAVRECNALEVVAYNTRNDLQRLAPLSASRGLYQENLAKENSPAQEMSELLEVARQFRHSFEPQLSSDCERMLSAEIFGSSESSLPSRILDFYQSSNFGDAISNDTCDRLLVGVEGLGGLQALGQKLIPGILALLPDSVHGSRTALRSTLFGSAVVDAGLSDTIHLGRQVVYELFLLVVFLNCEVEQDDVGSEDEFHAAALFAKMLSVLKEYEKKVWLLSHVRGVSIKSATSSPDLAVGAIEEKLCMHTPTVQVTLLHDTRGKDIKPQPAVEWGQGHLLTEMLTDIEAWVGGASDISADDGYVWLQCDLLAHDEIPLASDFARFQPDTPWSAYIMGRLYLARRNYEEAALCFQRCAYPLALGKAIGMLTDMSAGLLNMDDADHFNHGILSYFQHVASLFTRNKAYSFAADFARLALAATQQGQNDRKESDLENILCDLFAAEIQGCRYMAAFAALTQIQNAELQERLSSAWLDAVLGINLRRRLLEPTSIIALLQSLSLDLHPIIAQVIDNRLATLAQKQVSTREPAGHGYPWSPERSGLDYIKILYALRLSQHDYRGAIPVMMARLRLVKRSNQARNDPQAVELRHNLLALINVMSCVAPDEAYIISSIAEENLASSRFSSSNTTTTQNSRDGISPAPAPAPAPAPDSNKRDIQSGWKPRKKMIITLDHLRHEYQQLLDQCSRIERGDFEFGVVTTANGGGSAHGSDTDMSDVEDREDHSDESDQGRGGEDG